MNGKRFAIAVEAASWLSIIMRVAQFLFFSSAPAWSKVTFAVLAAMLAGVAVQAGMRVS